MHPFIASSLLIVCGVVDATFYNARSQTLNQLMERRQRSIGLQYPYGYHYNPIEPSINDLGSLSETLDSRINTYEPIYQHVKIFTNDVNSVPRTQSYQPKNSLYDSEYITEQDVPNLFPEESSDYKYLGSPLNKYQTRPSTTESDNVNLLAIRKTSVFDYGFPTYKSPYSLDSVWNFGSKIPNTVFEDSQSVESDPKTLKESSPTVRIVKLLPETLEHQPSTMKTKNLLHTLLKENKNKVQNSVKDELNYETTQETQTEESQIVDLPNILELEENPTKEKSTLLTIENLIEDESNFVTTKQTQIEDESNSLEFEENSTKNKSNFTIIEKILTEDESNFAIIEKILTEDESNSIATEETTTRDELTSLVFDSITTEDKLNSITTEETQTENDESTTSNLYLKSAKDINLQLNEIIKIYKKLKEQNMKSQFTTMDNISAKSLSNLSSDENTNQQLQSDPANEDYTYEESIR